MKDDEYLVLSGLQHFLFCRRQWALIHIEKQWRDNLLTTEGKLMHSRAHDQTQYEKRGDVLIVRGLMVHSDSLGVSGQCDVVEFYQDKSGISLNGHEGLWRAFPIEYKRGAPKSDLSDKAQLCAETICLEEMLGTEVRNGALYYGEIRRRVEIDFDEELRSKVVDSLSEMHSLYNRRHIPKTKTGKWCNACSLYEICLPGLMNKNSVQDSIERALCEDS